MSSQAAKLAAASWMIPVSGLCANMLNGTFSSFGVFMTPILKEFEWSRATISLAFSLYTVFSSFSAIASGRIADRFGPRISVAFGGLLVSIGLLLTSLTKEAWHLYLATGVILGSGVGAFWVSTMLWVARTFTESRQLSLAVAVNGSGTAVGSLLMPPVAALLSTLLGWRDAFACMAVVAVILVLPALTMLSLAPHTSIQGKPVSQESSTWEAVKTRDFQRLYAAACLGSFSQTMLQVHLAPYAVENGMPLTLAGLMMGSVGFACLIGRLGSGGPLAGVGAVNMLIITNLLISSVAILIIPLRDPLSLYSLSAIFGFSWGAWAPQFVMILIRRFGHKALGSVMGAFETFFGVGGIAGPSLGGHIRDISGTYSPAFLLSALSTALAAILVGTKKK